MKLLNCHDNFWGEIKWFTHEIKKYFHLCFVKILIISFTLRLGKLSQFCQKCERNYFHLLITHTNSNDGSTGRNKLKLTRSSDFFFFFFTLILSFSFLSLESFTLPTTHALLLVTESPTITTNSSLVKAIHGI